jgi:hypothetical protein
MCSLAFVCDLTAFEVLLWKLLIGLPAFDQFIAFSYVIEKKIHAILSSQMFI